MNNPYYQLSPFFSMGTNESPKDKCLPMTNLLVPSRVQGLGLELSLVTQGLGQGFKIIMANYIFFKKCRMCNSYDWFITIITFVQHAQGDSQGSNQRLILCIIHYLWTWFAFSYYMMPHDVISFKFNILTLDYLH